MATALLAIFMGRKGDHYKTHSFADNEDETLVCYCAWVGEEEEGECDVEKGEGSDDRCS